MSRLCELSRCDEVFAGRKVYAVRGEAMAAFAECHHRNSGASLLGAAQATRQ
jgi:hypothetical protein